MNAKHFIDVLKLVYRVEVKPVLGRWYIHNNTQTKLKIKYANEDNCGISSYYYENNENILQIKQNNEFIQEKDKDKELEEVYVYMMGLESTPDNLHTKR
jgi:hypothetical protein